MSQEAMWVPGAEIVQDSLNEFDLLVQRRYTLILQDMEANGYKHLIWVNWQPGSPGTELYDWLRSRDHMVSYISYVLRVCYGFKTVGDALLFKLTFG